MLSLQDQGIEEALRIRRRAIKLHGMDRISKEDCDRVTVSVDNLVATIRGIDEEQEEFSGSNK